MKEVIFVCLMLLSSSVFSQRLNTELLKFQSDSQNALEYANLLKIKDKEALFIKWGCTAYGTNPIFEHNFIVYRKDGKIQKYTVAYGHSTVKIKRIKIHKKSYKAYWQLLDDCIAKGRFDLEKSSLNATWIPQDGNSAVEKISVSDGNICVFELAQHNKNSYYASANPETYIKYKVYGFNERQDFLNLLNDFQKLFSEK